MGQVSVWIQLSLIGLHTLFLIIAASNLKALRRVEDFDLPQDNGLLQNLPRVSILVPARNEERNIEVCVRSLLAQDYPNFDLWVLDDYSQDRTGLILSDLAAQDTRLHLHQGKPLPKDWLGKHWACHQLSAVATGDLFLFTDADTYHHPLALRNSVAALLANSSDLVSAWPYQETETWGEQLIIPMAYWSFFSFLPFRIIHRIRWSFASVALGQFLLFRRQAYFQVGGHAGLRSHTAEDMALARKIKAHGLRWDLFDGTSRIGCRMYHNFDEAYQGFSKSLFAVFDYRILPAIACWLAAGFVFLEPLILLCGTLFKTGIPLLSHWLAAVIVGEFFCLWLIAVLRFRFPIQVVLFFPVSIALAFVMTLHSIRINLRRSGAWKGRLLVRPEIRWW